MVDGQPQAPTGPWVLPGEPVPVRLMNTVRADRNGVHDALLTPDDLGGWLTATGLPAGAVTYRDVAGFRALRDALRRLAALLTDDERPPAASPLRDLDAAVRQVNRAVDAAPASPRLQLLPSGLQRDDTPADPPGALAAVARQAVELLTGDSAALLRACHAPGCVLYFVKDHPRRAWCSTGCGNRVRAARHYQRRRAEPTPTGPAHTPRTVN